MSDFESNPFADPEAVNPFSVSFWNCQKTGVVVNIHKPLIKINTPKKSICYVERPFYFIRTDFKYQKNLD